MKSVIWVLILAPLFLTCTVAQVRTIGPLDDTPVSPRVDTVFWQYGSDETGNVYAPLPGKYPVSFGPIIRISPEAKVTGTFALDAVPDRKDDDGLLSFCVRNDGSVFLLVGHDRIAEVEDSLAHPAPAPARLYRAFDIAQFDPSAKYQRSISLPKDLVPLQLGVLHDGTFVIAGTLKRSSDTELPVVALLNADGGWVRRLESPPDSAGPKLIFRGTDQKVSHVVEVSGTHDPISLEIQKLVIAQDGTIYLKRFVVPGGPVVVITPDFERVSMVYVTVPKGAILFDVVAVGDHLFAKFASFNVASGARPGTVTTVSHSVSFASVSPTTGQILQSYAVEDPVLLHSFLVRVDPGTLTLLYAGGQGLRLVHAALY